MMGRVVGF